MSCIMSNRLILNVREVHRDIGLGSPSAHYRTGSSFIQIADEDSQGTNLFTRSGPLTKSELVELRSMRADHQFPV